MTCVKPDVGATPGDFIAMMSPGQTVVDVGCFGWLWASTCANGKLTYVGVDRAEPPRRPSGSLFARMDGHSLDVADDTADLVIASHVIEHLPNPVEFMAELARVTKPGGRIFLEAPSELSALPRSSEMADDHSFESFWDDPTHLRPYTPGALYRLAVSSALIPQFVSRGVRGGIPMVNMVAQVTFSGALEPRYCSFKGIPAGFKNAMQAVWPDRVRHLPASADSSFIVDWCRGELDTTS